MKWNLLIWLFIVDSGSRVHGASPPVSSLLTDVSKAVSVGHGEEAEDLPSFLTQLVTGFHLTFPLLMGDDRERARVAGVLLKYKGDIEWKINDLALVERDMKLWIDPSGLGMPFSSDYTKIVADIPNGIDLLFTTYFPKHPEQGAEMVAMLKRWTETPIDGNAVKRIIDETTSQIKGYLIGTLELIKNARSTLRDLAKSKDIHPVFVSVVNSSSTWLDFYERHFPMLIELNESLNHIFVDVGDKKRNIEPLVGLRDKVIWGTNVVKTISESVCGVESFDISFVRSVDDGYASREEKAQVLYEFTMNKGVPRELRTLMQYKDGITPEEFKTMNLYNSIHATTLDELMSFAEKALHCDDLSEIREHLQKELELLSCSNESVRKLINIYAELEKTLRLTIAVVGGPKLGELRTQAWKIVIENVRNYLIVERGWLKNTYHKTSPMMTNVLDVIVAECVKQGLIKKDTPETIATGLRECMKTAAQRMHTKFEWHGRYARRIDYSFYNNFLRLTKGVVDIIRETGKHAFPDTTVEASKGHSSYTWVIPETIVEASKGHSAYTWVILVFMVVVWWVM